MVKSYKHVHGWYNARWALMSKTHEAIDEFLEELTSYNY